MSELPPVRFSRSAADDEASPPQSAAQVLQEAFVDPVVWGAASTDTRVASMAGRGWCLFPPVNLTIDPDKDGAVSPAEATEYLSITRSQSEMVLGTLDTLWTVEVSEAFDLLVVPWVGQFTDWIVPQLVTAADGAVDLKIPVATTERVSIDKETPFVQLVPLPNALIDVPSEAGVPPDGFFDRLE